MGFAGASCTGCTSLARGVYFEMELPLKHIKFLFVVGLSFCMGYWFGAWSPSPISGGSVEAVSAAPVSDPDAARESASGMRGQLGVNLPSMPAQPAAPARNIFAPAAVAARLPASSSAGVPTEDKGKVEPALEGKPEKKVDDTEISDEEIDRVLPANYAALLKETPRFWRKKYKAFAAATSPDDWGIGMQANISEFILRSELAPSIELEGLRCAANLCELQLHETSAGAWESLKGEMSKQPWWDIGAVFTSEVGFEGNPRRLFYVLLPRAI